MKRPKHFYRKNREYLFVDGYNICNHWESLRDLTKRDLEEARGKLMDLLAEFSHYSGIFVILVFDGYRVKKSPGSEFYYKGIRVVFTQELETADHYIERELSEIGRHRNVRVATSDQMEQQIILGSGGKRMSARELEIEVARAKEGIHRKSESLKKNAFRMGALDESTLERLRSFREDLE